MGVKKEGTAAARGTAGNVSEPGGAHEGGDASQGQTPAKEEPNGTREASLGAIVRSVVTRFTPEDGDETTWVSLAEMRALPAFAVEVSIKRLADFLNAMSDATFAAGLLDVQFFAQKRTSKAADGLEQIYGAVIDIDRVTIDILLEVELAGVPMPNAYFRTAGGYKLVYASTTPLTSEAADDSARRLTLAFDGCDTRSWLSSQGQRLPTCLKTTNAGMMNVKERAFLGNAAPFDSAAIPFPGRLLRALGSWSPSPADRQCIRQFLEDIGTPAPQSGSVLYAACPACDAHGSKCAYLNVSDDGSINVVCLGGHGGEGKLRWSEPELLGLAGGQDGNEGGTASFNPLKDLPVTWAARRFLRHRLRAWSKEEREAAFDIWKSEKARREARERVAPAAMLEEVYRPRLDGSPGFGPMELYYNELGGQLAFDDPFGRRYPVRVKGVTLSFTTNLHEAKSTAAWGLVPIETKEGVVWTPGFIADGASLFNKALSGHPAALRTLGVPSARRYELPVAHVEETWAINPKTRVITATLLPVAISEAPEIDALEFFLGLFRTGRFPVASENDVRLFVACVASPLLRDVAPGQLGIYWFIGAPGSGKDFTAELAPGIWQAVRLDNQRVSFDFGVTDDLELKRAVDMAGDAVFARAKEAGKRRGMVELLIRAAGTDNLAGRGLNKDERNVSNTFTIIADSAEDLPDRREVNRRTVVITVAPLNNSYGALRDEVLANAAGILKNLKRIVESRPREWFRHQANTGSRPVIPVALARLFGATLPEVTGQDLGDLFEVMLAFANEPDGKRHGDEERLKAVKRKDKESREVLALPSYHLAYFIAQKSVVAGYRELFAKYGDATKKLVDRIKSEVGYDEVRSNKKSHLTVEILGETYAFKLVRSDRNFILIREAEYLDRLKAVGGTTSGTAADAPGAEGAATPSPATQQAPLDDAPRPSADTLSFTFSEEELLSASGRS